MMIPNGQQFINHTFQTLSLSTAASGSPPAFRTLKKLLFFREVSIHGDLQFIIRESFLHIVDNG